MSQGSNGKLNARTGASSSRKLEQVGLGLELHMIKPGGKATESKLVFLKAPPLYVGEAHLTKLLHTLELSVTDYKTSLFAATNSDCAFTNRTELSDVFESVLYHLPEAIT